MIFAMFKLSIPARAWLRAWAFGIAMMLVAGHGAMAQFTLTLQPNTIPSGTENAAYSQMVTAVGGTAPYTFAVIAGALPVGLTLAPNGLLSGTPTTPNSYSFTIEATDSGANTGFRPYTFSIGEDGLLTLAPGTLPNGSVGSAYNQTVTASNGSGGYTYSISAGSLPTGLALNPGTGAITGTPSAGGTFNFTVSAVDTDGNTGSQAYSVGIGTASLTINPTTLPNGQLTVAYNQAVAASGGTGPYTYAVSAGALPGGLSLDVNTGAITGTPNAGGVFNFTIRAVDTLSNFGTRAYTVGIGSNILVLTPATLPNGSLTVPYDSRVFASGGTAPRTFSISAGALPNGLSIAANGRITGTPTVAGLFNFTVRADDSVGNFGTRAYSINIGSSILTINPATLPPAQQGAPYSQQLTATGGTGPYTFEMTSGALPSGLGMSSTGLISGAVTVSGTFTFMVRATDVNGDIGLRSYTLTPVRPNPADDPEVQGILRGQIAATRRFSSAQIDNVGRHLESLHDRFNACSLDFGVQMQQAQQPASPYGYPQQGWDGYRDNPMTAYGQYGQYGQMPPPAPRPLEDCGGSAWGSSVAFWLGGALEFGSAAGGSSLQFSTSGLTAGVDVRFGRGLIVGVAVGYGKDRTEVGSNGTTSNGAATSGIVYASFNPAGAVFIDGLAGYSALSFDARRFVTIDNTFATGSRQGDSWFAAVSASLGLRFNALKVTPFVRADIGSARLAAYSEEGVSFSLLTYDAMELSSSSMGLGVRGSYDFAMRWGVVSPLARVEYRYAIEGAAAQSLYYSDFGSSTATTWNQAAASRSLMLGAVGLRATAGQGLSVDVEYGVTTAEQILQSQSLRGALRLMF